VLKFKWIAFFVINLLVAIGIAFGYSVLQNQPRPTLTEIPQKMEVSPSPEPSVTHS
jgi:hypothetical protein